MPIIIFIHLRPISYDLGADIINKQTTKETVCELPSLLTRLCPISPTQYLKLCSQIKTDVYSSYTPFCRYGHVMNQSCSHLESWI